MQTSTGMGRLRKGTSLTQTAQSAWDPRTLNGGQDIQGIFKGKTMGAMAGVTEH